MGFDVYTEPMSGYTAVLNTVQNLTIENVYIGVMKNGNLLSMVMAVNLTKTGNLSSSQQRIGTINVPGNIAAKLHPTYVGQYQFLDNQKINAWRTYSASVPCNCFIEKNGTDINFFNNSFDDLSVNEKYYLRYEVNFLLSDPLIN